MARGAYWGEDQGGWVGWLTEVMGRSGHGLAEVIGWDKDWQEAYQVLALFDGHALEFFRQEWVLK